MALNIELSPADTTPEALQVEAAIFRRMTPDQRMALAFRMTASLRTVAAAGVRNRHPEYSEQQVKMAVIRMSLGDELFRKVYPGQDVAL